MFIHGFPSISKLSGQSKLIFCSLGMVLVLDKQSGYQHVQVRVNVLFSTRPEKLVHTIPLHRFYVLFQLPI